jgi:ubiquinone biosynthesis protein COQ4
VSFIDDADLAYIMRRYREIHDLTHVTLGMPINMLGKSFFQFILFHFKINS